MPLTHEFGIIEDVQEKVYERYTPVTHDCVSLDDDIILDLIYSLNIMPTYFHQLDRPSFGLAYYGITIIPPTSLSLFLEIVLSSDAWKRYKDLNELAVKIKQAKDLQRYMIHYGI